MVFVAVEGVGRFEARSVRVAEYAGPRVFLDDGVQVGERVVERGALLLNCLLYTSDAADERSSVDLGGRRIIKKKNKGREGGLRTLSQTVIQVE